VLEVAQQLDLSLYLGLWVGPPPESSDVEPAFDLDLKELQRLIEEHPDWIRDHVLGISVGSEALYRKDATLDEMIENFNTGTSLERGYRKAP
jgi:exo-beta-1,3-glucanase (GH17 family)